MVTPGTAVSMSLANSRALCASGGQNLEDLDSRRPQERSAVSLDAERVSRAVWQRTHLPCRCDINEVLRN